jgi:membrane protein DedA with SNARE-associated domain
MGLTEFIIHYATAFIEKTGLLGIGLLMTLESMVAPVPSEGVMPFAGFLWFEGKFSFWPIVIASTVGSLIGSLISYSIGALLGEPFVHRFGKVLLLNEHHLAKTKTFFARYGEKTVFISRFVPVVRHLISIPAGVGRMNLVRFCVYTVIGAGLWNAFLTWVGFQLGSNWQLVRKWSEIIDVMIVISIVAIVIFFFYHQRKRKQQIVTEKEVSPSLERRD